MSEKSNQKNIEALQKELKVLTPQAILLWAINTFKDRVAFASSLGLEDQVLTDMIAKVAPSFKIFTLDTGRLFLETHDLIHQTEQRYGLKIRIFFPDTNEVEWLVNESGTNLFRRSVDLRKKCCEIRKVHPLKRALSGLEAWVCGLRAEQSMTRSDLKTIDWDSTNDLLKINPLASWNLAQVWSYIKENNVPYNPLHDKGFSSIGCACCTRAVKEDEDVRSGRWWWEPAEQKECGLHFKDGKMIRNKTGTNS
jgi:phosphoadenosine phosphosulfate reductase